MICGNALTEKVLVLGVDGLDPRYAKRLMDEGKMPNLKQYVERGACREDLVLLGSQPTVTPPQWTTLATGCHPNVHSITQFSRHDPDNFEQILYNIDSRLCKAEPVWNCTAEAGKKTCVFHWPGSAWPPTSDSPNLYVVDGTAPGAPGMGVLQKEGEFFLIASEETSIARLLGTTEGTGAIPCVINEVPLEGDEFGSGFDMGAVTTGGNTSVVWDGRDGYGLETGGMCMPYEYVQSYIRPASGWANAPEDAKEFEVLMAKGLVRRPGLILKNEAGIYDHVEIYRNKKDVEPLATCYVDKIVPGVIDETFKDDKKYTANRNYLVLELAEDGSKLRMHFSAAYDLNTDSVFHPKHLRKALLENAGPFPPSTLFFSGGKSKEGTRLMLYGWDVIADWYSRAIHYLMDEEGVEVLLSHYHAIDLQEHTFIRHLKDQGRSTYSEEEYDQWLIDIYQQTDRYFGTFLHYLDEGVTIILTSDHAQVCPEHEPMVGVGDMNAAMNIPFMVDLGFTVLKKDENGNDIREVDWSKTRAIAQQGNDIFINLKGRNGGRGIVDPEDKYQLEEEIMTAIP